MIMSSELSFFEQIGGIYTEKDGLLYPNLLAEQKTENIEVGKYGLLWISFLKENYLERYRHHIRMGQLQSRAAEVNEEAYEMLDSISEKYLKKHKPVNPNSTMEMWKLKEQAKQIAEEEVYETDFIELYESLADKEKADWIGITPENTDESIRLFTEKMKELGINYRYSPDMLDEFMRLEEVAARENRTEIRNYQWSREEERKR